MTALHTRVSPDVCAAIVERLRAEPDGLGGFVAVDEGEN